MIRLRLPPVSARPAWTPPPAGPGHVTLVLPARDEAGRVGAVIRRVPAEVHGRDVRCIVVDDGSTDATAAEAALAGATVVHHDSGRGLGAAVRTGLREAVDGGAAVVAFCDADGEYAPEELGVMVAPLLEDRADYVVGSRFAGGSRMMRAHRRVGNVVLTRWMRWTAREPLSDAQSGYRAMTAAAAADAEIVHDYNYAQVLTLDLLAKGYRYAEVPISYRFRTSGRSFVRLPAYLRRVIPAVLRELRSTV